MFLGSFIKKSYLLIKSIFCLIFVSHKDPSSNIVFVTEISRNQSDLSMYNKKKKN